MNLSSMAASFAQPGRINGLTIKNRVVMGPMAAHAANRDGSPSEQTIAFYEARARGGVGMIIVGGISATPAALRHFGAARSLRFDIDDFIPGMQRLADTVHAYDVPIIAEIFPSQGRMAPPDPDGRILSASPVNVVTPEERLPRNFVLPGGIVTKSPHEATIADIKQFENEMLEAAERVHKSGWDGIEIAAHLSYFLSSFLAPRTNHRTDCYGGSPENRARILVDMVRQMRNRLGRDFIIGLRIIADDFIPNSLGPQGFSEVAQHVERAGIDYVALSPGCYETFDTSISDSDGNLVDTGISRVFKDALSVPILVQGLHDPARGAAALSQGVADFVMLARPLLADPDYARKACEGRFDQIVRCDRENLCLRRLLLNMPIRCSMNPEMGRESRTGSVPPVGRMLRAPLEQLALILTCKRAVVKVAAKFIKK